MPYLLALDQGTTSSRAIVFEGTRPIATAQKEFTQHFPQEAWVEHDAEEIWATQLAVAAEAMQRARIKAKDLAAIGVTNQRETVVAWDRRTGRPACRAIVWQDRRTAGVCDALREHPIAASLQQKTGLQIDAYFSATKMAWLLEHVPAVRELADANQLCLGTVDAWLIYNLTGGRVFATDPSNASRTMLFNLHTLDWDDALLAHFGIPRSALPRVVDSSGRLGETDADLLGAPIPIAGVAGDQQAALFGQAAFQPGTAKCTYGTGSFLLVNTGSTPVASQHRLLTTVGWRIAGQTTYALEGSVFIAGAVVQWLRDGLGIIRKSEEVETLAASVPDAGGVVFVPAFAGLGAPDWDAYARGTVLGLTRGTTAGHLARAALDAIGFQVADLLDAMAKDAPTPINELRVDGGACVNDGLMQWQSDLAQLPVVRAGVAETTALGAAMLAGLGVGVWSDTDELAAQWQADRRFEPGMASDAAAAKRARWRDAVQRSKGWAT